MLGITPVGMLYGTVRHVLLAALFAVAPFATSATTRDRGPCGEGELTAEAVGETLYLQWTGIITPPMNDRISTEFANRKGHIRTVVLDLSSCGGKLPELERTIATLKRIKDSHRLETKVGRGATCGSACIPLYLQGQTRWGALTSSWLFHEVSERKNNEGSKLTANRSATERLFQDYFLPAGVSEVWLNRLRLIVQHADYWQTGQNLVDDKSGVITHPIDNLEPNGTEQQRY